MKERQRTSSIELPSTVTLSDPAAAAAGAPSVAHWPTRALPTVERHAGMIVAGRYLLSHPLGEGGMGSVWAAKHLQTRKRVALKFIKRASPLARRRALREARAATVVQHPNILGVHDIVEVDGAPMLVMDLIDGESLGRYLARRVRLPLDEAAPILLRVVSAIDIANGVGVVHRDLKPDNILLASLPGGGHDVKVLDFGLARLTATEGDAATSGDLTRDGDVIGTPHYMSPEQAFGEHDVDHRADIWSLGVIFYECLAGARPFQGDNLGQVLKLLLSRQYVSLAAAAPGLPPEVTALVDRMLSFDRAARPSDLRGAREVLGRYCDAAGSGFALSRHDAALPAARLDAPKSASVFRRAALFGAAATGAVLLVMVGARRAGLTASASRPVAVHSPALARNPPLSPASALLTPPPARAAKASALDAGAVAPPPAPRPVRAHRHRAAPAARSVAPDASAPATVDEKLVPLFLE